MRPVRSGADRHQGHPRRGQHGVGAGRSGRRARPAGLAREPRPRHARRRRRAVRRGRRAHARHRGAEGAAVPDATRRGVRPVARRRRPGADPRGRPQPQPHRPLRRRPSGAEVQRTLDENAVAAGVEVHGPGVRARSARRRATRPAGRQAAGVRIARHRRTTARSCRSASSRRARSCSPPAGTGRCSPARRTRRRSPATGSPWRCAPGCPARDVEFVQFHPTVLWRGPDADGQQALISEAVRGEGAILYDAAGERVMAGVHPQEDLAPRDVVASAISRRMAEAPAGVDDHVYLDATHMGERFYDAVPGDHRRVPGGRHRSGARPHPRRAGGALRVRRHPRRPRRAHRAAPACTRSARSPAPACTAPTGWPATASPRASSPGRASGATWRGSCPSAVEPRPADVDGRRAVLVDADQRVAHPRRRCRGTSACCAAPRVSPPRRRRWSSTSTERRRDVVPHRAQLGGDEPAHRGRRPWSPRRRHATESRGLPPPHRPSRAAGRVADATSTSASIADWRRRRVGRTASAERSSAADVFTFHPLSERHAAPLDRRRARSRRRRGAGPAWRSSEDLAGGIDVTSTATVPADQRSSGEFGARGAGVVAGLPVGRGRDRRGVRARRRATLELPGRRRRPGRRRAGRSPRSQAPTRLLLTAERTRAEPAVPPQRRRHAHPPVGRRARGHDAPGCATRARRCPGCARSRSTACAAAAASTTAWRSATPRWSRTTTCSPPAASPRRSRAVRGLAATIPVEIEVDSLDGLRRGDRRPAPIWCCSTTSSPSRWRGRARSATRCDPAVVLEASGGLTLEIGAVRRSRQASTSSPSAS